jgi:hypothetical protein
VSAVQGAGERLACMHPQPPTLLPVDAPAALDRGSKRHMLPLVHHCAATPPPSPHPRRPSQQRFDTIQRCKLPSRKRAADGEEPPDSPTLKKRARVLATVQVATKDQRYQPDPVHLQVGAVAARPQACRCLGVLRGTFRAPPHPADAAA